MPALAGGALAVVIRLDLDEFRRNLWWVHGPCQRLSKPMGKIRLLLQRHHLCSGDYDAALGGQLF